MDERIDVLAVIQRETERAGGGAYQDGRDLVATYRAVQDLIEAAQYAADFVLNYSALTYSPAACKEAGDRLRAALANVALPALLDRVEECEVAVAQAVAFAEYAEGAAKGAMVERARHFLSVPFADRIRALLAIAEANEGDGWLPIESAPRDEEVMVFDRYLGVRFARYDEPEDLFGDAKSWLLHVTHWRPLPAAPRLAPVGDTDEP